MIVSAGAKTNAVDINAIGVVARAVRTTAKSSITSETGYLRLDDIPVLAGYVYKIYTSNLTMDSSADNEIMAARIRVVQAASPGTAATTSSTQIGMLRDFQDEDTQAGLTPIITDYFPSSSGYLSVILTAQRVTALGTAQLFASATEPCHLVVQCIGKDPGDTGVSL